MISIMTDKGTIVGELKMIKDNVAYVQNVISGSTVCGPASTIKPVSEEQLEKIEWSIEMATTLIKSQERVAGEQAASPRRKLIDRLSEYAISSGMQLAEAGAFFKFTISNSDNVIYLSKRLGRIDIAGFEVKSNLFRQIDRDEAKKRKLGRISSQAIDIDNGSIEDLWKMCVDSALAKDCV